MSEEDFDDMEDSEEYEEDDEEKAVVGTQENQNPTTKTSVGFEYKLYNLFNAIRHLDNVNIKATKEGLEFWGMNESNAMMTIVKIDKKYLDNYKFKEDLEIATSTDYLKIVKRLWLVKAYIDEQRMVFEEGKTKIEMPVLELESREKPNLDLKKAVSFDLSATEVRKTLNDIIAIDSDSFELEFKDKSAIFSAEGKYGNFTKTLEPYERGIKKFEKAKDSIKVFLSVDLFKNALNGISSKIRITIGENSPIIVENSEEESEYKMPLTEKVTHYVAPRCSDY